MNIYANIINRFFDYKGQAWQVISQVKECKRRMSSNPGFPIWGNELTTGAAYRECCNAKTSEVVKFGYEEFWKFTSRGYTHNGIVEGK